MLEALTLILTCQLIGEVMVLVSGLPVPGPVLGMLLLLAWLFLRGSVSEGVGRTCSTGKESGTSGRPSPPPSSSEP